MVSCCRFCATTGKGQLLNQWLAVAFAVPLLERDNSRTNGYLLLWLCHYWKGSTLEPVILAVVVGVPLLERVNSRTND